MYVDTADNPVLDFNKQVYCSFWMTEFCQTFPVDIAT